MKNGIDKALFIKINSVEKSYATKAANEQWTKKLIEERSHDMADMLYKVLVKEIK